MRRGTSKRRSELTRPAYFKNSQLSFLILFYISMMRLLSSESIVVAARLLPYYQPANHKPQTMASSA